MGLIRSLVQSVKGRDPIRDSRSLEDFLDRHAAFISQSCVVEFCRVRAGIYWQKLFEEKEFQDRLYDSCWKSFTPALVMLTEMVDAHLREPAGLRQRALPAALEKVALSVMARHPLPEGSPMDFWAVEQDLLHAQISALKEQPARPVREMTSPMAKVIYNNLRMNLLRAHEIFIGGFDGKALADDLL